MKLLSLHAASVSRSSRFTRYNIQKVRRYLTQYAAQLILQALVMSKLDYCNATLTGLPACVVRPLQIIQNAAARLVFLSAKEDTYNASAGNSTGSL